MLDEDVERWLPGRARRLVVVVLVLPQDVSRPRIDPDPIGRNDRRPGELAPDRIDVCFGVSFRPGRGDETGKFGATDLEVRAPLTGDCSVGRWFLVAGSRHQARFVPACLRTCDSRDLDRPDDGEVRELGEEVTWDLLFGDDVEAGLVGELGILADCLADRNPPIGQQSRDLGDNARFAGAPDGDREDCQVKQRREVHQTRNLGDVPEDPLQLGIFEDGVCGRIDDPAIHPGLRRDLGVRDLDRARDDPAGLVY